MATLNQETQNIDCVDLRKRKYVITKYTFTKIDKKIKTVWNKYQPDTFPNKFDTLKEAEDAYNEKHCPPTPPENEY